MSQKNADTGTFDPDLDPKAWASADHIFPASIQTELRRAFTPRGLPFFYLYPELRRYELGKPIEEDPKLAFQRAANMLIRVVSPVDHQGLSPGVVNKIAEAKTALNTLFNRIVNGRLEDPATWARVNALYVPLMVEVAKDKGVYLKVQQYGRERWGVFRKMTVHQQYMEKLRDEDPESYSLLVLKGQTLEQIDQGITEAITRAGLTVEKKFWMGRPVYLGIDPVTGEERVYDRDGDVLTKDEYIAKQRQKDNASKTLAKDPTKLDSPLEDLRSLSDAEIDALGGDIAWEALSDDKAKQGRLTRIFACKQHPTYITDPASGETRVEKVKVIVSGRYKGIYLDDMVNANGRLLEGTAFGFDPKAARDHRVPRKIDPSQREPYVTVAEVVTKQKIGETTFEDKEAKLFLKVPGSRAFTELRAAMKSLACNTGAKRGCIASVSYHPVQGSNAAAFYFEPKDFAAVRDALKGLSLSTAALDLVKGYYKELARAEEATAASNLANYSTDALGGFKVVKKNADSGEIRKFDLLTKQKQALAWLDANGGHGICAMEPGVGKTLTSIAIMQKMLRDGLADSDASYEHPNGKTVTTNGRFLFVCPTSLKGNLPKEIRSFISDPKDLLERTDIISFQEFASGSKSGKIPTSLRNVQYWKDRGGWDPSLYVTVFFDEAQELTDTGSFRFKAANSLHHPRKVLLTGSPMEGEPVDAFILASITNNKLLVGPSPEAQKNREELRRFMDRYTERVGGRVIGVKDDPSVKRDLDVWVKRNIFYVDKTDVEEFSLPALTAQTTALEMPPEVEQTYRAVAGGFAKTMKAMVAKFRDGGVTPDSRNPDMEKAFTRAFEPLLKLLNDLSNYPAEAMRDLAVMIRTEMMPSGKPIPKVLLKTIFEGRFPLTPDQLEEMAARIGNPKVEAATQHVFQKLSASPTSRALLFSDDKRLCTMTAKMLSTEIPGRHAVALGDSISIYEQGSPVGFVEFKMDPTEVLRIFGGNQAEADAAMNRTKGVSRIPLPFKAKAYRKYMDLPAHELYNVHYKADRWQQFVLKEVVTPMSEIVSCTLLGQVYQFGHNLQAFDQVIHLDRNTWSNENMKQRTARSWRQGQSRPVEETTIDMTYRASDGGIPLDGFDKTLDEIRSYFQGMEAELFQKIIKDAQGMALGEDWNAVRLRGASNVRLDQKVMELMASPFVGRSLPPGELK